MRQFSILLGVVALLAGCRAKHADWPEPPAVQPSEDAPPSGSRACGRTATCARSVPASTQAPAPVATATDPPPPVAPRPSPPPLVWRVEAPRIEPRDPLPDPEAEAVAEAVASRATSDCYDRNVAQQCGLLGFLLSDKKSGARQRLDAAADAYDRACRLGSAKDCGVFASMLKRGDTFPRSLSRAATVAERGCALGDDMSCAISGEMTLAGVLGPPDKVKAERILAARCQSNGGLCCFRLGQYTLDGTFRGGTEKARALLLKSCRLGLDAACHKLDEMRSAGGSP